MHAVRYDKNGDIILTEKSEKRPNAPVPPKKQSVRWNDQKEKSSATIVPVAPIEKPTVQYKPKKPTLVTSSIAEGVKQFSATVSDAKRGGADLARSIRALPSRMHRGMAQVWHAASTPVTLRGKRKQKTRTRGQMFLLDTVRFGGTFALIFAVLFVGMNAKSYWQIAKSALALGVDTETTEALEKLSIGDTVLTDAGRTVYAPGSILQYLPTAGPPENRIVIPKLGINAPISVPDMKALLAQDWKQFELDIQEALEYGIVHYPGSARPGQAGNAFYTGHSSYYAWAKGSYKEIFARLHKLEIGDTYFIYHNGDKHKYLVTKKYEVRPTDVSVLDQPSTKRLSTLMTCTPVGTTLRRLIVQAEEIDPLTGVALAVGEKLPATPASEIFTGLTALPI